MLGRNFIASVIALLSLVLFCKTSEAHTAATVAANAQAAIDAGDTPSWWTPDLPADIKRNVASKGQGLAERLQLGDEAKTQKVGQLVGEHFGRVWAWHQQVDDDLNAAWDAWSAARDNTNGKEKDELRALAVMSEQIDPIYAEFAPQIRYFLGAMHEAVGEEKTTELLDIITHSPGAPRTYKAYLGMVPEMTEEEKAILWDRMVQAREDALAAWSGKQIIRIFKKYKIRNEFSIDYFGYGYRERYTAWASGAR